jgi:acyl-CoA thioesterase
MDYSTTLVAAWPKPDDCPTTAAHAEALRVKGAISEAQFKEFGRALGANNHLFETRYCLNGVSGQNLSGTAKDVVTTQDSLPITSKVSAEWQRSLAKLNSPVANFAALAFLMDGALSFTPMTHEHMWFDDVGACSTLDFALRIFVPEVSMDTWTLKERFTSRGGSARTYSEGRLWDEKGQLIASMT